MGKYKSETGKGRQPVKGEVLVKLLGGKLEFNSASEQ